MIFKFCIILLLQLFLIQSSYASAPATFYKSKKLLPSVYYDNQRDFYCSCKYDYRLVKGRKKAVVDASSCGYKPRKNFNRGRYIEWEHVVPASVLGRDLTCWKNNICIDRKGKRYKGRRCCGKIDTAFKKMEADMHNLVPAVGELNADRSNYSFGIVNKKIKRYGACEFYIENRIVEPREEIKGDIARIYFYMIDRYDVAISEAEKQLFSYWNKIDKISIFERVRNQRITNIQGNSNRFVAE